MAKASAAPPLVPHGGEVDHVEFLGLPFCLLTQAEDHRRHHIRLRCTPIATLVTQNAYHVVAAHDEPARLLPIYRSAWLSVCDSRIVRALAWLDRQPLPLVTGSDLVLALLARLNGYDPPDQPRRILVVGPPRSAEATLRAAYPNVICEVIPSPGDMLAQWVWAVRRGGRPQMP